MIQARFLSLVVAASLLPACGVAPSSPAVVEQADTVPVAAPGSFCLALPEPAPPDDPWTAIGRCGYVVSNPVSYPIGSAWYGVVGYDAAMQHLLWTRTVATAAEVTHYQTLPGTLALTYNLSKGVTSGGSTDTGGSGDPPPAEVCFLQSDITTMQQRAVQLACGTQACGSVADACGYPMSCGTCGPGSTCGDQNVCVCSGSCPKGQYFDTDSCSCKLGLPR